MSDQGERHATTESHETGRSQLQPDDATGGDILVEAMREAGEQLLVNGDACGA